MIGKESMSGQDLKLREFIKEMQVLIGHEDQATVMNWLEFACDVCEDNPSELRNELNGILRSLYFVKNNFEPTVLKSSLKALVLPSEIIYGAMLFHKGWDIDTVLKSAKTGALECGYIPDSRYEVGNLSLIQFKEEPASILMVANEPVEKIQSLLERTACFAEEQGVSMADLLSNRDFTHIWLYRISPGILSQAALESFSSSTAVGRLFSLQEYSFTEIVNPLLSGEQNICCVEDETLEYSVENVSRFCRSDTVHTLLYGHPAELGWQTLYRIHEEAVEALKYLSDDTSGSEYLPEVRSIVQKAAETISDRSMDMTEPKYDGLAEEQPDFIPYW